MPKKEPRQPRLPGVTTGHFGGGSEAFEPENWKVQPPGGRTAIFHSSHEAALPARDNPMEAGPPDTHDSQGRPMVNYGSAIGMHFGTLQAASERGSDRPNVHIAAVNRSDVVTPEMASPEAQAPFEQHPGWGPSTLAISHHDPHLWSDEGANYSEKVTDIVHAGKAIPYENTGEDIGTTSYRVKPEKVTTWSEDVLRTDAAHEAGETGPGVPASRPSRAHVEMAKAGMEPVVPHLENQQQVRDERETEFVPESRWTPETYMKRQGLTKPESMSHMDPVQFALFDPPSLFSESGSPPEADENQFHPSVADDEGSPNYSKYRSELISRHLEKNRAENTASMQRQDQVLNQHQMRKVGPRQAGSQGT